ncbi:MAG: ion channel [Jhaorihella sp.]
MTLGQQLLWGGVTMGLCLVIETLFLVWATTILRRIARRLWAASPSAGAGTLILTALVFILLAHTAQIAIWSCVWLQSGALGTWNEAVYFSLVTYTTVGYGDITLEPGLRVFGTFAGVAGVLGFGISTAFLIALMTRLLQDRLFSTIGK